MKKLITTLTSVLICTIAAYSAPIEYSVKVGETVRLEIPDGGRAILSGATGKLGQWDVNDLYLELESYSWDYAVVRGKAATNSTPVQLTVTFNKNGHYGDHYYAAYLVTVLPDDEGQSGGTMDARLSQHEVTIEVGETCNLSATLIGTMDDYGFDWWTYDRDIVEVKGNGFDCEVTGIKLGTATVVVGSMFGYTFDTCTVTVTATTDIGEAKVTETGEFEITGNSLRFASPCMVQVFDVTGRCEYSGKTQCVEFLQKGIYIVKTPHGTKKIII